MGVDLTSFDNALKIQYSKDYVNNLVYKDNPLLAMISKREDFVGKSKEVLFEYANPQARSVSFTRAQARSLLSTTKLAAPFVTRVKDYAVAVIDNETLLASENDSGALLQAATTEINGSINALKRSIATALYKPGYGDLGQLSGSASVTGTTLTLANADDIVNFEVGMELEVASSQVASSRAFGSSGNGLIVTGIDRIAGTLTFGANVNDSTNGVPAIAASDFLFARGDHNAAVRSKLSGLEAWVPYTAPTSGDSFFGVDRSADAVRLAGSRLDGTGAPIEEVLIDASAQVGREGYALTHYFMNFKQYAALEKALGSKVQYVDMSVDAQVAFRGVMINGVRGPIRVVPDMNCPSNRVWGLNLDSWTLETLGAAPRPIDTDGLQMLRQGSADGVEVRYGYYGQVTCKLPASNICIKV